MQKLYTIKEVSEMLKINYTVLSTRIREGHFPAINIAPQINQKAIWRIKESDLENFIS